MFVEGKVFSDKRVNSSTTPEVIKQIRAYTDGIAEQRSEILTEYAKHIEFINGLFGTSYSPPTDIIDKAKLVVYDTPIEPRPHGLRSISDIENEIGKANVYWHRGETPPTLCEIWGALCK